MSEQAEDITSHRFTSADSVLFDTNIWLYLYGPASASRRRENRIYSKALRDMRTAGADIYLAPVVLSEFVNAFARIEHGVARSTSREVEGFKSWRDSEAFEPVAQEIAHNATQILKVSRRSQWAFEATDVGSMLVQFAQGCTDFNDLILADVCKQHDLILVTHDDDFQSAGIPILTANRRLVS